MLHYLCHALNLIGQHAFIVQINSGEEFVTNCDLLTPIASAEMLFYYRQSGREPICVYPEIKMEAPYASPRTVRYLLHYAGEYGGQKDFHPSEKVWSYSNGIAERQGNKKVLFLPVIDPLVFYPPKGQTIFRSGSVYYNHKYRMLHEGEHDVSISAKEITQDWPTTRNKLADLLRTSERLYVYEDTALIIEALLCGCPVTLMRNPYFQTTHGIENIGDLAEGVSWNDEPQKPAARNPIECYTNQILGTFWHQLDVFVSDTQKWD